MTSADSLKGIFGQSLKTNMRKQLKKKKRSCSLCKPHKMKIENRWKAKEKQDLKEFEKEKCQLKNSKN